MLGILTLFLPLIGFLISCAIGKKFNNKISQYSTSSLLIISSILSWIIFFDILFFPNVEKIYLFNWINSGDFNVDWSIRIDSLTSVMLIIITNISAAIHVYSIGYMHNDKSISRFMSYLSLFTFFMLCLVTSDNLLQLFFGWEGVGLASYLLIGFWHHKNSANNAAIKAFIVNRIGDFAFFLGIVGVFFVFNSIYFDEIFNQLDNISAKEFNFLSLNLPIIETLCVLLFIGAMGKSAQLGLHTWLPDAMEGPTPVSALIHAATMVTAGVFLVCRMSPLFYISEFTSMFVTIIGASTAIFAAIIATTQNDIKKVIAYSTCSQLGYMFFAAGIGAYNAAMFHLLTHAFFKALLFLCAGSVIHSLNNEQDMRKMGGISSKIPITTFLMWLGSLAIIGFPFLSGYYSKETILVSSYYTNTSISIFAYTIGIITSGLTGYYSWRLLFLTFHGESRVKKEIYDNIHESPIVMIIPLIFLGIGAIISGILFFDIFIGNQSNIFWNQSLIPFNDGDYHLPFYQSLLVKIILCLGIFIATIIFYFKLKIPNLFMKIINPLYKLSYNKLYIDELYNYLFVNNLFKIADTFWKKIDENIIDGYGPNGISKTIRLLAKKSSKFQTGYLYHYAFAMFIGLVGFLTWFIYN